MGVTVSVQLFLGLRIGDVLKREPAHRGVIRPLDFRYPLGPGFSLALIHSQERESASLSNLNGIAVFLILSLVKACKTRTVVWGYSAQLFHQFANRDLLQTGHRFSNSGPLTFCRVRTSKLVELLDGSFP